VQANLSISEKMPVPCQSCHATGLKAGTECRDCRGRGYQLVTSGKLMALGRLEKRKQWQSRRDNRVLRQ
jgi:DnaJ-class molecular chaperone